MVMLTINRSVFILYVMFVCLLAKHGVFSFVYGFYENIVEIYEVNN